MKRSITLVLLLCSLIFILASLYVYLFKGAPLKLFIITILFFGSCAIVESISLTAKNKKWFIVDAKDLNRNQNIIMGASSLIFAGCLFWIALVSRTHSMLKIILFVGSLFFLMGPVMLVKQFLNQKRR